MILWYDSMICGGRRQPWELVIPLVWLTIAGEVSAALCEMGLWLSEKCIFFQHLSRHHKVSYLGLVRTISPEPALTPVLERNEARCSDTSKATEKISIKPTISTKLTWFPVCCISSAVVCLCLFPYHLPTIIISVSSFLPFSTCLVKAGLCWLASPTAILPLLLKCLGFQN